MKIKHSLLSCLLTFFLLGCASHYVLPPPIPFKIRAYNLETGDLCEGFIQDARQTQGAITGINKTTGETFKGEYTTIISDTTTSSYAGGYSSTFGWATAQGFSFGQPRKLYGTATLVGDKGTVVEIVYATDRQTLHGHGVGRDNKGHLKP